MTFFGGEVVNRKSQKRHDGDRRQFHRSNDRPGFAGFSPTRKAAQTTERSRDQMRVHEQALSYDLAAPAWQLPDWGGDSPHSRIIHPGLLTPGICLS